MFRDIVTVARFSILRFVQGGRALIGLLIMLAMTTLPSVITALGEQPFELGGRQQSQALLRIYDFDVMRQLAACPPSMVLAGIVTYSSLPLVTLLFAYDAMAREREVGTLRFSCMRSSWCGLVVGRALAAWLCYAGIALLSHVPAWTLEIIRRAGLRLDVFAWGARLYAITCIQAMVFVSIGVMISCLSKKAWTSFALGIALMTALGLMRRAQRLVGPHILGQFLPGSIDAQLLSSSIGQQVTGTLVACAWTVGVTVTATCVLARAEI